MVKCRWGRVMEEGEGHEEMPGWCGEGVARCREGTVMHEGEDAVGGPGYSGNGV